MQIVDGERQLVEAEIVTGGGHHFKMAWSIKVPYTLLAIIMAVIMGEHSLRLLFGKKEEERVCQ